MSITLITTLLFIFFFKPWLSCAGNLFEQLTACDPESRFSATSQEDEFFITTYVLSKSIMERNPNLLITRRKISEGNDFFDKDIQHPIHAPFHKMDDVFSLLSSLHTSEHKTYTLEIFQCQTRLPFMQSEKMTHFAFTPPYLKSHARKKYGGYKVCEPDFSGCPNLESLILLNTGISTLPPSIQKLTKLENLEIISDILSVPSWVAELPHIQNISIKSSVLMDYTIWDPSLPPMAREPLNIMSYARGFVAAIFGPAGGEWNARIRPYRKNIDIPSWDFSFKNPPVTSETCACLDRLPPEIILTIASYLDSKTRSTLSLGNQRLACVLFQTPYLTLSISPFEPSKQQCMFVFTDGKGQDIGKRPVYECLTVEKALNDDKTKDDIYRVGLSWHRSAEEPPFLTFESLYIKVHQKIKIRRDFLKHKVSFVQKVSRCLALKELQGHDIASLFYYLSPDDCGLIRTFSTDITPGFEETVCDSVQGAAAEACI
ncbi:hypothetical protein EIL50_03675 [bacterium NHP-B]|nr:hypothetical protein EIL50_03675 [bacterium NHP-B]